MELLHKSLEEFVEEFRSLYDTDYPLHAVREVFQEHERQRLSKFNVFKNSMLVQFSFSLCDAFAQ